MERLPCRFKSQPRWRWPVPESLQRLFWAGEGAGFHPIYVRGEGYLAAQPGAKAAFDKPNAMIPMRDGIKLHTEIRMPKGGAREPLPFLIERSPQFGRAFALPGDKAKAKTAYKDFLTLWKYADPDIRSSRKPRRNTGGCRAAELAAFFPGSPQSDGHSWRKISFVRSRWIRCRCSGLLGVHVDVVTPGGLRYLRHRVLTEAVPLEECPLKNQRHTFDTFGMRPSGS